MFYPRRGGSGMRGSFFKRREGPGGEPIDWDRWHDLLDIRNQRPLTSDERAEYDEFAQIVANLDAEEAAVARPAVEALVQGHERVLASIERLTEAVRAAADRV